VNEAKVLFNDIIGPEFRYSSEQAKFLQKAVQWSDGFLEKHEQRFKERARLGWVRDLHGDLHTGNVFLTDPPVIFDCIEFSKRIRTIDFLYEVAFICMDLERFGKEHWATYFLETYLKSIPVFEPDKDEAIFTYFKCLRANVRAKVLGLDPARNKQKKEAQKAYFQLMEQYMKQH